MFRKIKEKQGKQMIVKGREENEGVHQRNGETMQAERTGKQ